MNKKKVLVFIDWFLPGYKAGGPIQSCANLIDHLKGNEFEFYVVTRNTDYCDSEPYANVLSNQWNKISEDVYVYYFSKEKLKYKNIIHLIQTTSFDLAYLNGMFSFYYTIIPLLYFRNTKKKVVVATRGMLASNALAIKSFKKTFFLRLAKFWGLFKNVHFHVTSESEILDVHREIGKNAKINYALNLPKKVVLLIDLKRDKIEGSLRLISIARISPEKNLKYALEVLQGVTGNVVFDIYGVIYDHAYWEECKKAMKEIPSSIKVNYRQALPSNEVYPTLLNYDFLFMPTLGENFGHIILESFTAGCPVIISDQTIWKNLEEKKTGWDWPLSNKNNFIATIEKCISMNNLTYKELSLASVEYAKNYANNKDLIEKSKLVFSI